MPRPLLTALAGLAVALAAATGAAAVPAGGDRPAGTASTWGHELNQDELPGWRPGATRPLVAPRVWYRTVERTLLRSGAAGLWFSGPSALPFPPLPLAPAEPQGWRTPARLARAYRATGLKWDVSYEVWAARKALDRGATVADPTQPKTAYTRRLSLLDPVYRRESLREIRRIAPTVRGKPYVNLWTGSDEPVISLPRGRKARSSPFGRALARQFRAATGMALPDPAARPSSSPAAARRWLAWNRFSSARFLALKATQARLIRKLDPGARVSPDDFGFIDGFLPWDWTRLRPIADVVEADPYVSYAERANPGRGRYNPGFAAKLLSDLTGRRVRIVIQGFTYSRYRPVAGDLWTWTAQALRAGATDVSFFGSDDPKYTNKPLYAGMLAVARAMRGARLPAAPTDPQQLVLYATASEGQGQPALRGGNRARTTGDALYTTYALLGELEGAAFSFDADTRLAARPARLAAARTLWMPRADTLAPRFADQVLAWVRAGGTLIVTDPAAFTRTPGGAPLTAVRDALIGAPLTTGRAGSLIEVQPGALAPGEPDDLLDAPIDTPSPRAFAAVPAGARVVGRFLSGAPAVIERPVGAGRVLAFSADPMTPGVLDSPLDLARLVGAIHAWAGGALDQPAWDYRLPGDPDPGRAPWQGAVAPAAARAGLQ